MKKYIYAKLGSGSTSVWSTDPSTLDLVYNEVKKLIPTCETRYEAFDLTGAKVYFSLHKLQDKDRQVADWLVKLLCENGYEPFSLIYEGGTSLNNNVKFYHFRKEVEA